MVSRAGSLRIPELLVVLTAFTGCDVISPGSAVNPVVEDIGALPGDSCSAGFGINDQGHVVGVSYNARIDSAGRPFYWRPATGIRELPSAIGRSTIATHINNEGEIAGWFASSDSVISRAVRWSSVDADPNVLEFSGYKYVSARPRAISNDGEVLVHLQIPDSGGQAHGPRSLVWDRNAVRPLEHPGCSALYGSDMNELGEFAVNISGCEAGEYGAGILSPEGLRILASIAWTSGINKNREVVGHIGISAGAEPGYWDRLGRWHTDEKYSFLRLINDRRDFAGTVWDGWERTTALLLRDGTSYRFPNPRGESEVAAMNNAGQMVGSSGRFGSNCTVAVRWSP